MSDPITQPVQGSISFKVVASEGGDKFRVRVIGTGFGANFEDGKQWFVPDTPEGIGSARETFGGAKVHWDLDPESGTFDHAKNGDLGWLSGRVAGYLSDLVLGSDGLEATLNVHPSTPQFVREKIEAGEIGLSIEAFADRRPAIRAGENGESVEVVELVNFHHPTERPASVALVTNPALRGEILRVAASIQQEAQAVAEKKKSEAEAAEKAKADEAAKALAASAGADVLASIKAEKEALAKEREAIAKDLADAKIARVHASTERQVKAAKLPEKAEAMVLEKFKPTIDAGGEVTDEEIKASVESMRELLKGDAALDSGGAVTIGTEPRDRLILRMENFHTRGAPEYVRAGMDKEAGKPLRERLREAGMGGHDMEGSFLNLFQDGTGHRFADLRSRKSKAVRASIITSTWADLWENVRNRVFLTTYNENDVYQDWRKVAKVVPVSDFTKQERQVQGGYANLSTVSEGANYTAFTTPGDEGHGYTATKRGNTEDVTWEAMLRDDVGALAPIPFKMGLAASRTLYEFVFDLYSIAGQPTMDYDATALYDAGHSNTGTTALAAAEVIVARLAMKNQADLTNSKKLGVIPRYMLVPDELEDEAFDILKPLDQYPGGSTTDNAFVRTFKLEPIVVQHWTNATDWFLAASPFEFPTCEVGFVSGQEQPEMFVQDDRNVGSMFDADKLTYKIKHSYGGTILRHEGVYGENVA